MIFTSWEDLIGKNITDVKTFKFDDPQNNSCHDFTWNVMFCKEGIFIQQHHVERWEWGWLDFINISDVEGFYDDLKGHTTNFDVMPDELKEIINQYKQIEKI